MKDNTQPLCPSAQPDWKGALLIGIIEGTAKIPLMAHIASPQPVTKKILDLSHPVTPTEVFRFAAPCISDECIHFNGQKCQLATRVVQLLPEVVERLPLCAIRSQCRWWLQESEAACMRCPQVVTDNYNPSGIMRQATAPAEL